MIRILALALLAPSVSLANTVGCGANSFSYGEVDTRSTAPERRGVVEALPDSLCADLIEKRQNSIESLSIVIDPRRSRDENPNPRERRP